jgi:hypothetical protein
LKLVLPPLAGILSSLVPSFSLLVHIHPLGLVGKLLVLFVDAL